MESLCQFHEGDEIRKRIAIYHLIRDDMQPDKMVSIKVSIFCQLFTSALCQVDPHARTLSIWGSVQGRGC